MAKKKLVYQVDGSAAVFWSGCVAAALFGTFENNVTTKEKSHFRHHRLRGWTPVTHDEGSSRAIHPMNFCHDIILARVSSTALTPEPDK